MLLEAEQIGAGASGRSGGQVLAGLACGTRALERLVGESAARAIFDITVEGVRLQRDLIARHAIDVAVAEEAMALDDVSFARMLVDPAVPRGACTRLAAGMTPAKAHPYLVSFIKLGLVAQDVLVSLLEDLGRREIVPALDRGLIDAAEFNNASSDRVLGFPDVAKNCMLQSFHQSGEQFEILFNKAKYDGLPPELKKVIDANSGPEPSAWVGKVFVEDITPGRKAAEARKNTFYSLPAAEVKRWEALADGVLDFLLLDDERLDLVHARARLLVMFGATGRAAQWGDGTYENVFIKENGTWKFLNLMGTMGMYTDYDDGWAKKAAPMMSYFPGYPPDQPTSIQYEPYPAQFVTPFHYKNPVSGK